nr:VanZ family protein [Flavobacterium sp.]
MFTFVWFLFFRKQLRFYNNLKPLLTAFMFSFVFGIGIELMQQFFTTTRQADVLDGVANVTGALLAVLAVIICNKFNILNSILKN